MFTRHMLCSNKWAMPKHVRLAMSVHHCTGSAELITVLNRFGHCQSHSRTLELETAMCKSVMSSNTYLPPSISTESNKIVHFCWDNFGLNEETPSGTGTTHTVHGIVIQEVEADAVIQSRDLPQIPKSHKRTVQPQIQEPPPCFAKDKAEPVLNVTRSNTEIYDATYIGFSDFMWLLCRTNNCERLQNVPSWAGWLSSTSHCPRLTNPLTQSRNAQLLITWHLFSFPLLKMRQFNMF